MEDIRVDIAAQQIPEKLYLMPLLSVVIYPYSVVQLLVRRKQNIDLIEHLQSQGIDILGLLVPKDPHLPEDADPKMLHPIGVAARIINTMRVGGSLQVVLQGIARIRMIEFLQEKPHLIGRVEDIEQPHVESAQTQTLLTDALRLFNRFISTNPRYSEEIIHIVEMNRQEGPGVISDLIASYINFRIDEKQELLELVDVDSRLRKLIDLLQRELEFLKVESEVQGRAKMEMEKAQREYFLRRQMEEIKKELGEGDQVSSDVATLKSRLEKLDLPKDVLELAAKEIGRLENMPSSSADYNVIHTYVETLLDLPWRIMTEDNLDIRKAAEILDQDHHGLIHVKERVLEYLSVLKLKRDLKGPILCLIGPPGVGKTSLGQSIARALGRKFVRMSLGGVRDEAEIRGHRKTYVGAMPGRIVQGIRKGGTRNPLFMIDEIDKISAERGDPASALLEVLDPEQNHNFRDNYIEIPFDVSSVLFITTANYMDAIPAPLLDRMEVIHLPGYTMEEKEMIARKYLVAKQREAHGLKESQISFSDEAIRWIIRGYTKEAGVRNLDREIAHICRKAAKDIAEGAAGPYIIKANSLEKYLGPIKHIAEEARTEDEIGVATGLAVTPTGGELLHIEATKVRGKEGIKLTGHLGDIMQESVQAALTYVRSKSEELGISQKEFEEHILHVHFPAGAVPKDGPSAGVAIATALASLMSGLAVRKDVAMTGEISLRGHVLPVGGIKDKILAAYRAGIPIVIMPEKNKNDLYDIPKEVERKTSFIYVNHADQVLREALVGGENLELK
ncbi:MAG: endopeptidase La, partial [Deltaproteobacteria bacterium]|nr:endopeptidase La [Deltaproteobacteria bacterium]